MKFKENKNTEYKKASTSLPKSFWETYSSFANTDGGIVYLGIDEPKKGIFKCTGVNSPDKIENELVTLLRNRNKISWNLISENDISILILENKKIIRINIPEAPASRKPIYLNDNIKNSYIRMGDADQKINNDELRQFISDANIQATDSSPLQGFDLDDLVLSDIEEYRNQYNKFTDDIYNTKEKTKSFLLRIGAMAKDRNSNEIRLNEAGLLFFGKYNSIIDKFPGFQLDFTKKNNNADVNWINRISSGDMNNPEMNIYRYYKIIFDQLKSSIPQTFEQSSDGTQTNYYRNMSIAIREALVNMLMHAYYGSNNPITILDTNNFLEFRNPGKMLVSREEFIMGSRSIPRNPRLAILFRKIGLAERAGSGGQRIYAMTEKNSLRTPDVITGPTDTTIRIWKTNLEGSKINGLNGLEKEIATFTFQHTLIKFSDIKEKLANKNITDYQIRNTIKSLQSKNIIEKSGNGKGTKYFISQNDLAGKQAYMQLIKSLEIDL